MHHNFLRVRRPSTQPILRLFHQQSSQQIARICGDIPRELDLLHQDQREQDVVITVVERQPAAHHLVHYDSGAPPVHGQPVIVVLEHLRGQVFRRAAEGLRGATVRDLFLAQAKVGDLDVAVLVQQQVLQLQIPVHDLVRVQISVCGEVKRANKNKIISTCVHAFVLQ